MFFVFFVIGVFAVSAVIAGLFLNAFVLMVLTLILSVGCKLFDDIKPYSGFEGFFLLTVYGLTLAWIVKAISFLLS